MAEMEKRMGSEDLTLMVQSIEISRQTGGNLTEVFDRISETIRERATLKGQVQAMTANGRMTAVILSLLSLPFKMIAGLQDLWIQIPSVASRMKPFAIVGVALCYLIMASTIVGVVGRDLRHPATTPARED